MFHPSKNLGQNFLINEGIVDKIIIASELSKDDTILEIGPGKGALTEKLLQHAGRVIAVEKDKQLFELLKEKFSTAKNLELINGDILSLYPLPYTLYPNYKLIANIPYNITGQIFRKFLSPPSSSSLLVLQGGGGRHRPVGDIENIPPLTPPLSTRREKGLEGRPQMLVVMVQKEVGERILGKKDKSMLSLLADLYGKTEKVCDVSPGSFNPPPKVTSTVVKLTSQPYLSSSTREAEYSGIQINTELHNKILHLARIGFSSKRKKLISNLSTGLKIDKKIMSKVFSELGFSENVRAEELLKDDWLKLAENV